MKKLLLTILILLVTTQIAWASQTASTSPGTMVNNDAVGTVPWLTPDNAKISDNLYASTTLYNNQSNWLQASNFGFAIPSNATIDGIIVETEAKIDLGTWILDYVRLVKGGVIGSTNKTLGVYPTTDTYKMAGTNSYLWGTTWTPSDINNSNFGITISTAQDTSGTRIISVDHIRVTVFYTETIVSPISVKFNSSAQIKSNLIIK